MRLTEKIKAITQGSQPDGYGGSIPVDVIEFETWASIEQLRTSKDIEQAQLNLPATYRVKTRKEFFEHNLVEWRGKKYSILSTPQVDFVRRSRFYTFNMTEAVI